MLSNQPLFTCDDTGGDIFFSKGYGGNGVDYVWLCFRSGLVGDFDARVEFSDAVLDNTGDGGNDATLWAGIGAYFFVVARTDQGSGGGDQVNVWVVPPGNWYGTPETANAGSLRMTRQGSTVTG